MLFQKGKVILFLGCVFCAYLFSASASAFIVKKEPLATKDAFAFSYTVSQPNTVVLHWKIAPGYYLYRERFKVETAPTAKLDIQYPATEKHEKHQVYTKDIDVPVIVDSSALQYKMHVHYQGCSVEGFCYPPMDEEIALTLANPTAQATAPAPQANLNALVTDQNGVNALLHSQHMGVVLLLFIGLGLLLAFTPCVFPMVPILTSIIVGQKQPVSSSKALLLSSIYVLGSAATYAAAGTFAAYMGSTLQVWLQSPWIIAATAGLFVLLAFSLFGFYELRLPNRLNNHLSKLNSKQQGGTYFGVFFMGMLSTLVVSPCVTAPLVGVLMFISQTGNLVLGASALFAMGVGMGIPLVIIGTTAGRWLPKSGTWMETVKKSFGVLMLGMAVWLIARIVSPTISLIFWGVLLLIVAVFLVNTMPHLRRVRRLLRSIGVAVGFTGMLIIFGGMGIPNPMTRWITSNYQTSETRFVTVHDISDFNKQLMMAQAVGQPVILDFYADWCESCVSMDAHVFALPNVQQKLSSFLLLRADLSANTASDEAMLKHFKVVAPPTVLFFDAEGKEMDSQRIVGEVDATEFLGRLDRL